MATNIAYKEVPQENLSFLTGKERYDQSNDDLQSSRTRRWVPSTKTALFLTLLTLTANIVVMLVMAFGSHNSTEHCTAPDTFHGTLGKSTAWQSVDHEYDSYWGDIGGVSGVIKMPHPDFDGKMMPASISMIHQLHCLASFRHAIQQGHDGVDPGLDFRDNAHWPHCLDYMRKTILCWADDTIERQGRLDNGSLAGFIDGATDVRTCRNSEKLIQQMADAGKPLNTAPLPFTVDK